MPINYLIVEAPYKLHKFYGDTYRVECPTRSGNFLSLEGIAQELTQRLQRLFLKDSTGRRAYLGGSSREWEDVEFCDHLQFHEYFHGDTGRGLGASHQGWTGLIALLLHPRDEMDPSHITPAEETNAADAKA
jgi:hypothetical protein